MDSIQIEVLDDGTVSVKTSDISEVNHLSADELLDEITDIVGGVRKTEKRQHPFWNKRKVGLHGKIQKVKR